MGCEGEPIELQDYMPPELQALRKKIAAYTGGKLGQTATAMPEGMPLSAPVNQLQLNAAQMMNQLMGAGQFSMPPYRTSGGMGSSGGVGGGGGRSGGGGGSGGSGFVTPSNPGGPSFHYPPPGPFQGYAYPSFPGGSGLDLLSGFPGGIGGNPLAEKYFGNLMSPEDIWKAAMERRAQNTSGGSYLPSNYT